MGTMGVMSRGWTASIAAALLLAAVSGFGQSVKGRAPAASKAPPKTSNAASPKDAGLARELEPPPAVTAAPMTGRGEAKTTLGAKPIADAGVTVVEKDGGARQFRFTETDIEGRLKAPQIVYFLRRVRAEFAAGDLGHRSFMRELSETRRDRNFDGTTDRSIVHGASRRCRVGYDRPLGRAPSLRPILRAR